MNFAFTEDQGLIRDSARGWLGAYAGPAHARTVMATAAGFDPALWAEAVALGWTGLIVPEAQGGLGLGFVELAILAEEMGRALYPSPFEATVILAANVLLAVGSERYLEDIATGALTATLAAGNATGKVTATPAGGGWRLDGALRHVPDGARADLLLVAAEAGEGRIALFAVPGDEAGLTRSGLATMDQLRRPAALRFDGVTLGAGALVAADAGRGLALALDRAAAALSAWAVGAAERCLEMTVDYTKGRVQFGRPVAGFQAVKHQCADMALAVETARSAAYWAACIADETGHDGDGRALALAASGAKSWCSRAYFDCAATAIQLHGGVGFTWDYDVHLYFKNARAMEATLGDPAFHRERVAQLIGLDETAEALP
ncbi:acyl-CoA dehydrogenase family protein [Zavarzinia compransoris]|uniref:Acyl-CoA dehydrogenase n=1 Tax=Zavarzinia compransoris TaxID=1264899 RepID=A0A317DSC0_9PROT|nr:acyl-CoA dehydrogenase family protein [Zavarzinia compransoris]PWR17561.1 acyl-CoA dehydrogenase [Zavarzinia compransoris]TDP49219.1 alkylation response protein AidB-like acyl-CoA dehydrogenase [Zavarzinia compransoris]